MKNTRRDIHRSFGGIAIIGLFAAAVGGVHQVRAAADRRGEEAAIRKIIEATGSDTMTRVPYTSDAIGWTGAIQKPVMIGREKGVPTTNERGLANRVPGSQRLEMHPVRIVVSEAADMAYEYSTGTINFDLKSGQHVELQTSELRVWQKDNGQWKVAAFFQHPHQE